MKLRAATCQWTATAYLPARRIASSNACGSVIVFLCTSDVSLSKSTKNKAIFGTRVILAGVTHPVSEVIRLLKTASGDLAALPSIFAAGNRTVGCAVFVVLVETNIACTSQSRTCRHVVKGKRNYMT